MASDLSSVETSALSVCSSCDSETTVTVSFERADGQRHVDAADRVDADGNAGLDELLEALERHLHGVGAGLHVGEAVRAGLVADRRPFQCRLGADDRDRRAGNRRAGLVFDRACYAAVELLRVAHRGKHEGHQTPHADRSEDLPRPIHHETPPACRSTPSGNECGPIDATEGRKPSRPHLALVAISPRASTLPFERAWSVRLGDGARHAGAIAETCGKKRRDRASGEEVRPLSRKR